MSMDLRKAHRELLQREHDLKRDRKKRTRYAVVKWRGDGRYSLPGDAVRVYRREASAEKYARKYPAQSLVVRTFRVCGRNASGPANPDHCDLGEDHAGGCHGAPLGECRKCGAFMVRDAGVLVCHRGCRGAWPIPLGY